MEVWTSRSSFIKENLNEDIIQFTRQQRLFLYINIIIASTTTTVYWAIREYQRPHAAVGTCSTHHPYWTPNPTWLLLLFSGHLHLPCPADQKPVRAKVSFAVDLNLIGLGHVSEVTGNLSLPRVLLYYITENCIMALCTYL